MVLHPCLKELVSKLRLGYLDDVFFGDYWRTDLKDLIVLRKSAERVGLQLNVKKCEIAAFGPNKETIESEFIAKFPNITVVNPSMTTLLGAGLGEEAIRFELKSKLDNVKRLTERTHQLKSQAAFFLMKNCFMMPMLMYVLRASPAFKHDDLLKEFDQHVSTELARVFNCLLNERSQQQISLPTKDGGFGVLSASSISSSTFTSSYVATATLKTKIYSCVKADVLFTEATRHWESLSGHSYTSQTLSVHQKGGLSPIFQRQFTALLDSANSLREAARLQAAQAVGAGDWIEVLPSRPLGLNISDDEFRIASALRLGAPVTAQHKCKCGLFAAADGLHALICPKIKHRFTRNNNCNVLVKEALKTAKIPSTLEPVGLLCKDGRRSDGLTLILWSVGRTLAWDFTCISRLANSNVQSGALPGSTPASQAETGKRFYSDLPTFVHFEPIAIDTSGAIGRTALTFLQDLASCVDTVTVDLAYFRKLKQRFSLAIQRGKAGCIMEPLEG